MPNSIITLGLNSIGLTRIPLLRTNVTHLHISGDPLEHLIDEDVYIINLEYLSINQCGITSLTNIERYKNLYMLDAGSNKISDLVPLMRGYYRELYLINNLIDNVDVLKSCLDLVALYIDFNVR